MEFLDNEDEEPERFYVQVCTTVVGCNHAAAERGDDNKVTFEDRQLVYLVQHGAGLRVEDEAGNVAGNLPTNVGRHISKFLRNFPSMKPEAILSLKNRKSGRKRNDTQYKMPVCIAFCGRESDVGEDGESLKESLRVMMEDPLDTQMNDYENDSQENVTLRSLKDLKKEIEKGRREWDQAQRGGQKAPYWSSISTRFGEKWVPVGYYDTELLPRGAVLDIVEAPAGGIVVEDFDEKAYEQYLKKAQQGRLVFGDDGGQVISPVVEAAKGTVKKLPKFKNSQDAWSDLYNSMKDLAKMQPAEQPAAVVSNMYPHQLIGLVWVRQMERERTVEQVMTETKAKSALFWECKKVKKIKTFINEITNRSIPVEGAEAGDVPQYPRGGMLCDDMGLGKTLTLLSQVVSDPKPPGSNGLGTIIVCPVSVISSWVKQIQTHTPSLTICEYHGANRTLRLDTDVVITSFQTVLTSQDEICQHQYHRLIIDEAHEIRNRKAKKSEAVSSLAQQCSIVWAVTGTPIQNSVEDLYAFARVLKLHPFDDWTYFNSGILRPARRKGGDGLGKLVMLMKPFILRRTKDMKDKKGKPLVDLPKKTSEIIEIPLNAEDKKQYKEMWEMAKFDAMSGGQKNFGWKALVAIGRCRQFCLSPDLLPPDWKDELKKPDPNMPAAANRHLASQLSTASSASASQQHGDISKAERKKYVRMLEAKITGAQDGEQEDCSICLEKIEDCEGSAILYECKHIFHAKCIEEVFEDARARSLPKLCPLCRAEDQKIIPFGEEGSVRLTQRSPKMTKILELISAHENTAGKVVIFSMSKSFLDLLKQCIVQDYSTDYVVQIDGSVPASKRKTIQQKFQTNDETQVILCSTKAAGTGIDLTAGSLVIVSDPWWCPAVETQAEDRCHRIGQVNPVRVVRLVVKDSIEPKILMIQKGKEQAMKVIDSTPDTAKELVSNELCKLFDAPWIKGRKLKRGPSDDISASASASGVPRSRARRRHQPQPVPHQQQQFDPHPYDPDGPNYWV